MIERCATHYYLQYLHKDKSWITCTGLGSANKALAIATLSRIRQSADESEKFRLVEVKTIETVLPD